MNLYINTLIKVLQELFKKKPASSHQLVRTNYDEVKRVFGDPIIVKEEKNGFVTLDGTWRQANLVTIEVPLIKSLTCHKKLAILFTNFWNDIAKRYSQYIDIEDTRRDGGVYCSRHINFDKKKPLSFHSWGIAIDINPSSNKVGTPGNMPFELVILAEAYGLYWGGNFSTRDPMHMEVSQSLVDKLK